MEFRWLKRLVLRREEFPHWSRGVVVELILLVVVSLILLSSFPLSPSSFVSALHLRLLPRPTETSFPTFFVDCLRPQQRKYFDLQSQPEFLQKKFKKSSQR